MLRRDTQVCGLRPSAAYDCQVLSPGESPTLDGDDLALAASAARIGDTRPLGPPSAPRCRRPGGHTGRTNMGKVQIHAQTVPGRDRPPNSKGRVQARGADPCVSLPGRPPRGCPTSGPDRRMRTQRPSTDPAGVLSVAARLDGRLAPARGTDTGWQQWVYLNPIAQPIQACNRRPFHA